MTNPRDLIRRLADELESATSGIGDGWYDDLLIEARAYLAQPEPAAGRRMRSCSPCAWKLEASPVQQT